jgi:hypothetical protein
MANEKPVGKPYNIVYIERGTPTMTASAFVVGSLHSSTLAHTICVPKSPSP